MLSLFLILGIPILMGINSLFYFTPPFFSFFDNVFSLVYLYICFSFYLYMLAVSSFADARLVKLLILV